MWRYYRLAIFAATLLILAHLVASCIVRKAEIDELMREEEEVEVPLWASR